MLTVTKSGAHTARLTITASEAMKITILSCPACGKPGGGLVGHAGKTALLQCGACKYTSHEQAFSSDYEHYGKLWPWKEVEAALNKL